MSTASFKVFMKIAISILLFSTSLIPKTLYSQNPIFVKVESKEVVDCLAKVIYHEARGTGERSMVAVGHVVLNRTKHPKFPSGICQVINQPMQFSWVGSGVSITESSQWKLANKVAMQVLYGVADVTNGSTHFHSSLLDVDWSSSKMVKTVAIGGHQFYRLVGK
jgi:spore germination cell wall hydrolase CwlJ-like protein